MHKKAQNAQKNLFANIYIYIYIYSRLLGFKKMFLHETNTA